MKNLILDDMSRDKTVFSRRLGIGLTALLFSIGCRASSPSSSSKSASTIDRKYLAVSLSGGGSGAVTSSSDGLISGSASISCGATSGGGSVCATLFSPATIVTLTAAPATGSTPTWYGCTPSTPNALTCQVTTPNEPSPGPYADTFVRVNFDPPGRLPASASHSSIGAAPASVPADGVSSSLITVIVRDVSDTPVAGKPVVLSATGSNNTMAQPTVTGADGVATGTLASTTAEVKTVTATVDDVTLTAAVTFTALATVTGTVVAVDGTTGADRVVSGATVKAIVDGVVQPAGATTDATGSFSLKAQPGSVFLRIEPPVSSPLGQLVAAETRKAVFVSASGSTSAGQIKLVVAPPGNATYTGTEACTGCHTAHANKEATSAMSRSVTKVVRSGTGAAVAGAFTRMVNKTLSTPRQVMVPIGTGTIAIDSASAAVVGTTTTFTDGTILVGDKLVYTPAGLGQYTLGTVASITDDTHLTLTANGTFAPQITSISSQRFGVDRLSKTFANEMPMDATDIVAPNWPGVRATSPNSDPNSAGGGTQVQVYFCNLKGSTVQGVAYANDEYVQKFGGNPWTCSDGTFYDGVTAPAVPLVHIDYIYGGQGDTDGTGVQGNLPNLGVFKQRYQGRLSEVKYAYDNWKPGQAHGYTSAADMNRDTLTLPIQLLHSGDLQTGDGWLKGGYKLNGYHPTEQKFPGESWSQRTRTFSHACAGCHNNGLKLDFDVVAQPLAFPRDDGTQTMVLAAVKSYSWANNSSDLDFNIGCEQCHGPGSAHVALSTSTKNGGAIINPKYLTADGERQACGKCHAYDDGADGRVKDAALTGNQWVEQSYGFEAPWNSEKAAANGGDGNFVPGVDDLFNGVPGKDFLGNWADRAHDGEAGWNPDFTPLNKYATEGVGDRGRHVYLGQAHRQQYTMMQYSKHANNPFEQLTCSSCHDSHSTYLGTPTASDSSSNQWQFTNADFRTNVLCLSCHAGFGDYASVTKQDVANVHIAGGGSVTKNGAPVAATTATNGIAAAVTAHMRTRAAMVLTTTSYNPTADTVVPGNLTGASYTINAAKIVTNGPIGRCTSCHMPRLAKSGGYYNDTDAAGLLALVESDQASHTFDVIMPSTTPPLGSGGPTFQSGQYNYKGYVLNNGLPASNPGSAGPGNPVAKRYDYYGYMPNSCSKCHLGARKASLVVPDVTGLYPQGGSGSTANNARDVDSWWPLSEHLYDTSGALTDPSALKTCFDGTHYVFCNQIKATGALVPAQVLPAPVP